MELPTLIDALGYKTSDHFLRRDTAAFERAPDIGHILRAAAHRRACRLEGVYTLQSSAGTGSPVPVVYVCEAEDLAAADEIHRLVWNQDIVPFLMVHTPAGVRLYSGFTCNDANGGREGVLEPLIQFNEITERLAALRADSIDSGALWRARGADVQPDRRVYWSLLENLKLLAKRFRDQFGRDRVKGLIHPLIGKYVYLHYLKDRGFLSPKRLDKWQIEENTVFGRTATVIGLRSICEKLDGFLNGKVFPLKFRGPNAPTEDQVQRIAGAFSGDTFNGEWQFHLPFTAFKFDFIPIETLSMIYEQFLHLPDNAESDEDDEHSEGRKAGAYYTPIPVVNYMLAEMDKRRRLQRGVRVFDPSCGSGAFLVQCYRRLIEREFVHRRKKPAPHELATLLKRHIFGVDVDENACSVAEFSLYLTLLDYVEPADLVDHPRFRLPPLRKQNIFCSDFFKFQPFKTRFHWVVGNPPWKKLIPRKIEERDERALDWMKTHEETRPVGDNSLAQAFTWRCLDFVLTDGECALLLPAMTLFEDFSETFRRVFFREVRLLAVTNFSNLAEVLFAGRSRVPAAVLFFSRRKTKTPPDDLEKTTVFSPLVANQEGTRPVATGIRTETWTVTVNDDEIRNVSQCDIASGGGLPWKLALWGSFLDESLLRRMRKSWPSLREYEARWHSRKKQFVVSDPNQVLKVSEGLQVRTKGHSDEVDQVNGIAGQKTVDFEMLRGYRRLFSFPSFATPNLPSGTEYALKGRSERPLTICQPPHVVVSESRNFAVYCEDFLVVPARQIGIVSTSENRPLLKAIALYLSSDFAFYHQFFTATHFGVKRPIATLRALREIPIPLLKLTAAELGLWESLHDRLVQTTPRLISDSVALSANRNNLSANGGQESLIEELNKRVFELLDLDEVERALVHDLVHVRLALDDGKTGRAAMDAATNRELQAYAEWFQREFAGQSDGENVSVTIIHDDYSGFAAIEPNQNRASIRVLRADAEGARAMARTRDQLRNELAQWVYFDRSLRIYRGANTYIFKPIQRMHWTRTRAMLDAADVVIGNMHSENSRTHGK